MHRIKSQHKQPLSDILPAPKLSVIIVNWNAGKQLQDCLLSIQDSILEELELRRVVVVDNASKDHSLDDLDELKIPLKLIRNSANLGFAKACNQGAQTAEETDYLLFLNPDTRLYPDALRRSVKFLEEPNNSAYGICGIQLLNEANEVARSCARFPSPFMFLNEMSGLNYLFPELFRSHHMQEWPHDRNQSVDHVIGAYFLIRANLFKTLNGFDEQFFVYLEDLDLSYRASVAGWKTFYLAEVQSYHKGGGTSEQVKSARLFYSLQSRLKYAYKHFGSVWGLFLTVATFVLETPARLCLSLLKRSFKSALETLKAYGMLLKSFFS